MFSCYLKLKDLRTVNSWRTEGAAISFGGVLGSLADASPALTSEFASV